MQEKDFLELYLKHEGNIKHIYSHAAQVHENVNQTYGDGLPYAFHLKLAASFVTRFGHLVLQDESEIETIYAAAYFHDAIEDARLTYNDLVKTFNRLNTEGCCINTSVAAEAVYALTNDKGRTRAERASEKYYEGIRNTRYAAFLKMCDRLANLRYSTLFGIQSRMAQVYQKEHNHFLEAIGPVPQEMINQAENFFNEGLKLN